jgi:RNA polymerase sigma factor (sigma-70 family)
MSDTPDAELLEQFARNHSEAAFAELVERHLGLVYSAAFRKTDNPQHAEDIAQAVFIILARKADSLGPKTVLPGWLYHTARLTAANLQRAEIRRIRREQEAFMESTMKEPAPDALWCELSPLLEDAMAGMGATDRDAIVLRFFQNRSLADVGTSLGIAERAAQKRVNRALEKLRNFFTKRGVVSTTAIIAGAISNHSVQAAPMSLAKTISTVALAKGAAASTSTLILAKGAVKLMAWSKTKTTLVGVAIALLGIGTTAIVVDTLLPVPDIQGTWECTLNLPNGIHKGELAKNPLVMRIARVNGAYQANFDNIGLGHQDIVFDKFSYRYPYIYAESMYSNDDVTCIGKVSRSGEKISWKALENNQTYTMVFGRTNNPTPFPEPLTDAEFAPRAGSDLQGFWVGQIGRGKGALRVQIKIAEASDGTFRADFYVPDQSGARQPTAVSDDGTTVKLMPVDGQGMFEGRLRNGASEMSGNWLQRGGFTPTTLTQANYSEYRIK